MLPNADDARARTEDRLFLLTKILYRALLTI